MFQSERTFTSQLLPVFLWVPPGTTVLSFGSHPTHPPPQIFSPCPVFLTVSSSPSYLSFFKSDVCVKSCLKVIFSLSIDYLIQNNRTPRHSREQLLGPWDSFNLLLPKCFLRLIPFLPRLLPSCLSAHCPHWAVPADETSSLNQGTSVLFPPFCFFLIPRTCSIRVKLG